MRIFPLPDLKGIIHMGKIAPANSVGRSSSTAQGWNGI
jgi:hypothetical protein